MKHFSLALLLLIVTACSPNTSTSTPDNSPIPATHSPTATKPVAINPTPTITLSPIPTSIVNVDQFVLPDWLDDPNTTVAMMVTDVQEDEFQLAFLNVPTQEFFHIAISIEEVSGYFWMPEGKQFGLLLSGFQSILLVDTTTGTITQQDIPEAAMRFVDMNPEHLLYTLHVSEEEQLDQSDIYFVQRNFYEYRQTVEASYDLRFEVEQFYEYEENPIAIRNTQTGEALFESDPDDGLYDISATWSPNANFLAVMQNTEGPLHLFAPGDRILLLNQNGQIINKFFGNFLLPRWSPDGKKILYSVDLPTLMGHYPCIIDVYSGEQSCLEHIATRHASVGGIDFRWSSSGKSIIYGTRNDTVSMLCTIDLKTLKELCSSAHWETINVPDYALGGYSTSPNEEFIVFGFPECGGFCDYYDDTEIGILSMGGDQFYSLGFETRLFDPLFFYPRGSLLWRPQLMP